MPVFSGLAFIPALAFSVGVMKNTPTQSHIEKTVHLQSDKDTPAIVREQELALVARIKADPLNWELRCEMRELQHYINARPWADTRGSRDTWGN